MKYFVISIIVFVTARAQLPPDCIGPRCPIQCPPGSYRYAIGCDYLQPEPTCKNPCPEKETESQICDYQACYCNPPTVRDEKTKKCVKLEDCDKVPVTPVTPKTPATPQTPRTPQTPVTPRTPQTPITPRTPHTQVTTKKPVLPKPKIPIANALSQVSLFANHEWR